MLFRSRGRGGRGVRDATWGEVSNIRLEVICTRVLAETHTLIDDAAYHSAGVNLKKSYLLWQFNYVLLELRYLCNISRIITP